ncbi:TetR/AcrR family transcriptional regulator [Lysobacter firmicutimachus]|uniref:TetR/AcrR family transcriptional regulator n=1 Tax=Lysobacter firmicutimachus TaxID=1792846 RepID=A0AAU8MMJ4_9GAMM
MPLPRFERLPAAARAAFLDTARTHFARDGRDGASLNRIIDDSGISKSSAYHYFDGKSDLFETVAADSLQRAAQTLGEWSPAADADGLWRQFHAANERLGAFLAAHPDHRALLEQTPGDAPSSWFAAFFADAARLGLIDGTPDRRLIETASLAVLRAADRWALALPPERFDPIAAGAAVQALLQRLWRSG